MMTNNASADYFRQSLARSVLTGGVQLTPELFIALLQDPDLCLAKNYPHLIPYLDILLASWDEDAAEWLWAQIQPSVLDAITNPDPYRACAPASGEIPVIPDGIPLIQLPTGDRLENLPQDFLRNTLVLGATGRAKSTFVRWQARRLAERGFTVVYFDRKRNEARMLLGAPGMADRVTVLNPHHLRLVLFGEIPGVPQDIVNTTTLETVARITKRLTAHWILFPEIEKLLRQAGGGRGIPPDVLIQHLKTMTVRGLRQVELKEAMVMALVYFATYLRKAFVWKSDFMQKMFRKRGHIFVIEAPNISAEIFQGLVCLMTMWLYLQRTHRPEADPQPVIWILDDATTAVSKEMDEEASGASLLAEQTLMSRSLKTGYIINAHDANGTSDKIKKNAATVVVVGAQGEPLRVHEDLMGLSPEQADYPKRMPIGEAVCLCPTWPYALRGTFEDDHLQPVSDAQCESSAKAFLDGVTCEPLEAFSLDPGPTPPQAGSAPSKTPAVRPEVLRALDLFANEPLLSLTEHYKRLHLNNREGVKLIGEIRALGHIVVHEMQTGGRGRPIQLIEVKDAAKNLLRAKGYRVPDALVHGGFEHDLAAVAISIIGQPEKCRVDFEVTQGRVRFDIRKQFPAGQAELYQVGVSDPRREAEALSRALSLPSVCAGDDILTLIVREAAFGEKTMLSLRSLTSRADPESLMRIVLLGELICKASTVRQAGGKI
ncbi:MAG: hypothetical protein V1809_08885 [Planctomycetota bacterium]